LHAQQGQSAQRQTLTEGVQLRAARWLLDDRDAQGSLDRLKELPPASGRRMVAMRLQLKAARLAGQPAQALETAVLLAKHRAFSPSVAQSLVSRLILEWVASTHDAEGMQRVWKKLTPAQKLMPEVAAEAALRWLQLGGEPFQARQWLQAVIMPLLDTPTAWRDAVDMRFVQALEASLADTQSQDALDWLSRIERAQQALPRDPDLQFLAGMLCWRHKLWGKAQGLLSQSIKSLVEPTLRRQAWCALAESAEQRQDAEAAKNAWKQAAQTI
jgi:HemY protein